MSRLRNACQALWRPSKSSIDSSNMMNFIKFLNKEKPKSSRVINGQLNNYQDLQRWSLENTNDFWDAYMDYSGMILSKKGSRICDDTSSIFHKHRFFPDAKLNYAENLLLGFKQKLLSSSSSLSSDYFNEDATTAVVFWGEDRVKKHVSYKTLYKSVTQLAEYLKEKGGVKPGDIVAGFVPNTVEALIAMLATTSTGAVWSSCSPDFGKSSVVDRFGQIKPKVLFSADSYYYNAKKFSCVSKLKEIRRELPSVKLTIVFKYDVSDDTFVSSEEKENTDSNPTLQEEVFVNWESIVGEDKHATPPKLEFEQVPFNSPLFILFSSGTTGIPKCITHTVGGTLIQHMKEHQLHCDIKPNNRLFYYTTCGWMMWNWQVSCMASGSIPILYDGSPFLSSNPNILWDYTARESITLFGTSAKYIDTLHKNNLKPMQTHDLKSLRTITSTGSPLSPEMFDYTYRNIKQDVFLASISGGTDIISCFMLGNPIEPVYRGEIQTCGLGMDIDVYDDNGKALGIDHKGELVCKSPFPSMPLNFWNDNENDDKYRAAYFEKYPASSIGSVCWRHGDFVCKTKNGGYIVYGRSDATLNPGGVRIGTAEIYRQVEKIDEVLESIVVGQQVQAQGNTDVRVVLFVKLKKTSKLNENLKNRITKIIRENTSPKHVPDIILEVDDIPRTKSGKIVELAVRDVIDGKTVKNKGALANPEALEYFKDRKELI